MYSSELMFKRDFGKFSDKFPCVDQMGEPSSLVKSYLWIGIITIISGIAIYTISSKKIIKKFYSKIVNKKPKEVIEEEISEEEIIEEEAKSEEKSLINKIIGYLGISLVVIGIGIIIFYFYKYSSCYWPEYDNWYTTLPVDGRRQFDAIKTIQILRNDNNRLRRGSSEFAYNF